MKQKYIIHATYQILIILIATRFMNAYEPGPTDVSYLTNLAWILPAVLLYRAYKAKDGY